MSTVYVLNKDGKPLMPTTRGGHVRHLLKEQKARVARTKPFTIQLLYETDDAVQPLYLGIDPGRTNIGIAVVKADGTAVFTAHLETRNKEVPKLMQDRKKARRARRTNGKSTYDYRAAHGVSKDHWLDAYCIACSVLPSNVCDSNINNHMPYELKQFRRHDRRVLNNENMNRVYTLNNKAVAINRHKAKDQKTVSLEEFRKEHPDDVCKLKVKEHHPTYRNMNRNFPGSVFLVGKQIHIMQGIASSKDGKATKYNDTSATAIAAGKCKFVAKNTGILFV